MILPDVITPRLDFIRFRFTRAAHSTFAARAPRARLAASILLVDMALANPTPNSVLGGIGRLQLLNDVCQVLWQRHLSRHSSFGACPGSVAITLSVSRYAARDRRV